MTETNIGNFLSPEALIMLPLAITLDTVGIILVCFALDDFFITDIIGWATLGVWSAFRSQTKGSGSTIERPDIGERKEQAQELKQKQTPKEIKATKTTKAAKWAKWIRFLEFVPYLGALPFWTISTFLILKEN